MSHRKLIEDYFDAEERGDVARVVAMCAADVVIRNAAQPPQHGREGAREYVTTFRDRTEERRFRVLAIAEEGSVVFAWWEVDLTFRAGISFGPVMPKRAFTVNLYGICRFRIAENGMFNEIDVYHETTTPLKEAQEAAA